MPIADSSHHHQRTIRHAGAVVVLDCVQERDDIAALELDGYLVAYDRVDKPLQNGDALIHRADLGRLSLQIIGGDRAKPALR